jgi:hypothetical protein
MTPLLFAAAVALTAPVQSPSVSSVIVKVVPDAPASSFVTPDLLHRNLLGLAPACGKGVTQTLGRDGERAQKLGDLPPALEEHAVLRFIHGCPVREIVAASGVYYLDIPTGGLQRIDPAARFTWGAQKH